MIVLVGAIVIVLLAIAACISIGVLAASGPHAMAPDLVSRIVGTKARRPPSLPASAAVALALTGAAWIVAVQHGAPRLFIPDVLWTLGFWTVFAVFVTRGLAGYTPAFNYSRGTPFYDLNRRYCGPLCLAIALAILATRTPI